MTAKPKRPRNPKPTKDDTQRLADLMERMERLDADALQARLEFGKALKEARERPIDPLSQDEIVRELDTNRELLRRIQRRYEDTLES